MDGLGGGAKVCGIDSGGGEVLVVNICKEI